jgi:hypothetical protein
MIHDGKRYGIDYQSEFQRLVANGEIDSGEFNFQTGKDLIAHQLLTRYCR